MNINSDFKETNSPGASITMQHYIFAFVQNLINQPENPERSKDWLRSYCEKERMNYSELEYNLNVFFQLLFIGPSSAVNALQLLVFRITTPVRTGHAKHFDSFNVGSCW